MPSCSILSVTTRYLFIWSNISLRNKGSEFNANARGISLPVNAISDEMLKEALRKAIADENYEPCLKINEEVKRRGLDLNDASAPDDREE